MNWLDIIILVVLIGSVVVGLLTGIIRILFTLVGGILGVVLAGQFSQSLGNKLTFIHSPGAAHTTAFVFIIIVSVVVFMLIGLLVKKVASKLFIGWIDRLGGAVLGLVLGAIVIGALLTMYVKFQGGGNAVTASKFAGFFLNKFPVVLGMMPKDFQSVKDFFR
jgi:membrane protein required for colicin V production